MRCGPDLGRDRDFELGNFLEQALQDTGPRFPSLSWCSMLVLSFQSYLEIDQIETSFHQRLQLFARGIVHLARRLAERLCESSDHLCINRIVLGQASGRLRKAADSLPDGAPSPNRAHSRRWPPSPPCSPCACEARQPACDDPGQCSDTSAAAPTRECTHRPCPLLHRCRRQRDHFVPSSTPFLARYGLNGPCNCSG